MSIVTRFPKELCNAGLFSQGQGAKRMVAEKDAQGRGRQWSEGLHRLHYLICGDEVDVEGRKAPDEPEEQKAVANQNDAPDGLVYNQYPCIFPLCTGTVKLKVCKAVCRG